MNTTDDVETQVDGEALHQSSSHPTPIVPWKSIFAPDDLDLEPALNLISTEARGSRDKISPADSEGRHAYVIDGIYLVDVNGMAEYIKLSRAAEDQVVELTKDGEVVRTSIFIHADLCLIDLDSEGQEWPQFLIDMNPKTTFEIDSQEALDYMNSLFYGAPTTKLTRARLQDVKDKFERQRSLPIKLNVQEDPKNIKVISALDHSLRVVADTIQQRRLDFFPGVCQIGFMQEWDLLKTDRYDLSIETIAEEMPKFSKELPEQLLRHMHKAYTHLLSLHTSLFVVAHIAMGQLAVLNDYNDREERLEMWKNAMDSNVLDLVKKLFCTALNEDKLLLGTGPASWCYYITASLARLADDILMHQIVGDQVLEPYHPWIMSSFTHIMNGKGVCTQLRATEKLVLNNWFDRHSPAG
ncbi:hypothetical protein IFR05_000503 [Cadophora sp. M221]|nr:hypothetical protein IFR05_000503 [Cadophora sp. M221]